MAFRRGDVLLVPFPFSDLSATKVRPTVVVGVAPHIMHLSLISSWLRLRPTSPPQPVRWTCPCRIGRLPVYAILQL